MTRPVMRMLAAAAIWVASHETLAVENLPVADGRARPTMMTCAAAETENQGWLGVQVGPLPRMLATHLNRDTPGRSGILVRNTAKDGPADRAGIDRYDVITGLDGQPVGDDVAEFTRLLRSRPAETEVELAMIHRGAERTVRVRLSRMPSRERIVYKYPPEPDEIIRDTFNVRGKILRPNPNGPGYILEDLGDRPELEPFFFLFKDPGGNGDGETPGAVQEWRDAIRKHAEKLRRYGDLYKGYHDYFRQYREWLDRAKPDTGDSSPAAGDPSAKQPEHRDEASRLLPSRDFTAFSVEASGKIRATVRRGNSEITREYESAEQFRRTSPRLFREFESMQKHTE